jgi:hypothetical protein
LAKRAVLTWIGNAAAVLCGRHGDVTRHARQAGCSRPAAYGHAPRVRQAVTEARAGGPDRSALLAEVQRLREENCQVWEALEPAIDFPPAKQRRFVVTAAALGLSGRQTATLLDLPPLVQQVGQRGRIHGDAPAVQGHDAGPDFPVGVGPEIILGNHLGHVGDGVVPPEAGAQDLGLGVRGLNHRPALRNTFPATPAGPAWVCCSARCRRAWRWRSSNCAMISAFGGCRPPSATLGSWTPL